MAKARDIPAITPGATFRDAAASAVEVRAAEVFAFRDRALDIDDIEGVHDMRVATRRLRAVLEIFAVCFPPKKHRRALKEVKRLADVLGERRDPDVMIERLHELGDGVPGVRDLQEELRGRQAGANDRLAEELDRIERDELRERLFKLARKARQG